MFLLTAMIVYGFFHTYLLLGQKSSIFLNGQLDHRALNLIDLEYYTQYLNYYFWGQRHRPREKRQRRLLPGQHERVQVHLQHRHRRGHRAQAGPGLAQYAGEDREQRCQRAPAGEKEFFPVPPLRVLLGPAAAERHPSTEVCG